LWMADRLVTRITALPKPATFKETARSVQRVAAYARVSTDHEGQETSLAAQTDYYKKKITEHPGWEFVKIYVDDGFSGLSTNHREGFNHMMEDCLAGHIDLVLTKSISRLARNTVDTVTTIRKLKEKGVGVYFEKENIWTLDSKGELLITIMSSLAQEESRSISENVTWGQRKRMADGKVSFAYSRFLGLDKDNETGKIVVNPEQAEIVRLIFRLFLEGMTPHSIAAELTRRGIKTPTGKDVWNQQTVRRMLSNEKYKGDALLQKEFTVDFLEKKMKKNEGEVPQYYVEGNHEAIINPAVFDMVQAEIAKRTKGGTRYSGVSIFSNKIRCADCGGWYGAKTWHSTDRYRKVIYRCNRKYNGETCQTLHITEDEVKTAFVSAYNQLVTEKKEIIANAEIIRMTLCGTEALREEKVRLEDEMSVLVEMTQNIVAENARIAQDQDEYQKRYDGLVQRYDAIKARYDDMVAAISAKEAQSERLANFIKVLKSQDGTISDFDGSLWGGMVEFITVGRDKEITVTFRDGTEILA
jgi:site-specific DNA recombinase